MKYRNLIVGAGALGVALGVAFGAGVAMGRGNPREVEVGLSAAQVQQLYGASAGGGQAGASGGLPGAGGATSGSGPSGAGALANATLGRITAVEGSIVTVETAQGSTRLNLSPSTKVSKVTDGTTSDLQAGTIIAASGTRKDDGSMDVTSVSHVPPELQSLTSGGGARPTATPTRTP